MPNDTPQLCIDPITHVQVLYAPLRAKRTNALVREPCTLPVNDFCPFCPGHEKDTPPHVYRWPKAETTPWQLRVVPNRFPAVANGDEAADSAAFGHHSVLIESAKHDDDWTSLTVEQLARILEACAIQLKAWLSDARSRFVQVFKNVGTRAGATLAHPHLQLMSLNHVPDYVSTEFSHSQAEIANHLQHMVNNRSLQVHADQHFVTLCPSVSRVPYEVWILPLHEKPYTSLTEQEHQQLAQHIKVIHARLINAIGVVSHNIIWRLPPRGKDQYPWRIEILPRLTTFAGLEIGSGLYVNPILPDAAAGHLASAKQPA